MDAQKRVRQERDERPRTVTLLVGSPQKRGATFRAAETFASHLEALGDVETKIVWLGDYDIGTCRGCKLCVTRGEDRCPLRDDRDLVVGEMLAADAFVFAAPNYSWHVPGLLDWDYYRDQGWFESEYFYPVRLGWPKKTIGAFLDWFTARAGLFSTAKE